LTTPSPIPARSPWLQFGIGIASHLAGELLKQMAGINMVHVPYRGGAVMIPTCSPARCRSALM
jgi:tripartite-type tricarboxylate transporter receptor subunit TctC